MPNDRRHLMAALQSFLQDRRREKSSYPDQRDLHLLTPLAPSQRLVRAIAERRGLGLLALAQGDFFLFIY